MSFPLLYPRSELTLLNATRSHLSTFYIYWFSQQLLHNNIDISMYSHFGHGTGQGWAESFLLLGLLRMLFAIKYRWHFTKDVKLLILWAVFNIYNFDLKINLNILNCHIFYRINIDTFLSVLLCKPINFFKKNLDKFKITLD